MHYIQCYKYLQYNTFKYIKYFTKIPFISKISYSTYPMIQYIATQQFRGGSTVGVWVYVKGKLPRVRYYGFI